MVEYLQAKVLGMRFGLDVFLYKKSYFASPFDLSYRVFWPYHSYTRSLLRFRLKKLLGILTSIADSLFGAVACNEVKEKSHLESAMRRRNRLRRRRLARKLGLRARMRSWLNFEMLLLTPQSHKGSD